MPYLPRGRDEVGKYGFQTGETGLELRHNS